MEKIPFSELITDCTKDATKIPKSLYKPNGTTPIIDQGQEYIAGYSDEPEGIFFDTPAIIFGDHTRVFKYVDFPFFIGADGVKVLKAKKDVNYKYLYYYFLQAKFPNTGYARHFKWLKELQIPLRTIDEQNKIVSQLDNCKRVIEKYNLMLEKYNTLIKSRFIEMFGDPVLNEKNWEKVSLDSVADIKIGPFGSLLHQEDYISGGHALVNPSHIIGGKIKIDEKLTISDKKYEELEPYHLKINDVVMGRRGEMGRCAVVNQEGLLCGTGSIIIRTKGELEADFIQKIISFPSYKKTIEDKAVGQTMPNLNVPIVSSFEIIKPPKEVQNKYYSFVQQIDKSKFAVQKSLEKAETLYKSLMQEYFG